jgi:hypothetical protein
MHHNINLRLLLPATPERRALTLLVEENKNINQFNLTHRRGIEPQLAVVITDKELSCNLVSVCTIHHVAFLSPVSRHHTTV